MITSEQWVQSLNVGTIMTSLLVIGASIILILDKQAGRKERKK
jgi:hypothetical protein